VAPQNSDRTQNRTQHLKRCFFLALKKENKASTDTLSAVFHTDDFEDEFKRMQEAGVELERADMGGEFNMAIFSDPEGNMLSLEDGYLYIRVNSLIILHKNLITFMLALKKSLP